MYDNNSNNDDFLKGLKYGLPISLGLWVIIILLVKLILYLTS